MTSRPHVLLSVAMSVDGYIDDMRDPAVAALHETFGGVATVVGAGEPIDLDAVLDDEIHVVIAPFFVGDVGDVSAPRFVHPGRYPQDCGHPMSLAETRQIGNVVLLRYVTSAAR